MRNKTITAVAASLLLSAPLVTAHITKESATAPDPVMVTMERTASTSPAPEPSEQTSAPTTPKPSPKPTKTEAVEPAPETVSSPTQDPTPTLTPEPEPSLDPEPEPTYEAAPTTQDVEYYEVPVEYSSYEPTPEPEPEPEPTYTEEVYVEPTYIEEDEYVEESPDPVATETEEPVYDPKWDEVAECESGGDWSINTGNGFYGGLQFTIESWNAVGGDDFASRPDFASRDEQIIAAERLEDVQGMGAWPVCGAGY